MNSMDSKLFGSNRRWDLPPLILHPFSDASAPNKLVESSRANLMLQGLLPSGDLSAEQIERRLLEGRVCEIRMLFYVGRDLLRWVEQCMEVVERDPELAVAKIRPHSFLHLLIHDTPKPVKDKLRKWGVADYRAIFTRAIGLNTVFCQVPDPEILSTDFIRNYYRYADQLFSCSQRMCPFTPISSANFHFELFASGEYSRLLEREWEKDTD